VRRRGCCACPPLRVPVLVLGALAGALSGWAVPAPSRALAADAGGAGVAAGGYALSAAFRDALARDARVQAAEGRVAQARERLEEVKSGRRPSFTMTGNGGYAYNRNDARVLSVYEGRSLRAGLRISQNLYSFGRLRGRLRQAEAEISETEYAAGEVRQEVLAEVAQSFAEQSFRERMLERRRSFEELVGQLERSARERVEHGTLDRTELHDILRRLHRARAERIEAASHYRVARARLARLTGADRETLAPASLARLEAAAPPALEEALALAQRESPALARARQRLEAARGELAFREAELRPALNLESNTSTGRVDDIETFDIEGGINLSVPLYEGGLRRSQRRHARLAVETARRELAAERERIEVEVQAHWDLLESLALASRELEAAVADTAKVVELTRGKLDAGRATFVQHIEARQSALDAEFDLLDSRLRLEATRIALLRLLAALGA